MEQRPLVKNAADESQVKAAKSRAQTIRETEIQDIQHVLSSPQGRRFLWRYLDRCGVFRLSFNPMSESDTSFREGGRNVGLMLVTDITDADPEAFVRLLKEGKSNV